MHKRFVLAGGVFAASAVFMGCDQQATQQAQARAEMENAIALVEEAERGFAPQGFEGTTAEFRKTKFNEAVEQLQAIADQGGDTGASAMRLIANIKLSESRVLATEAARHYANVRGRTTSLDKRASAVGEVNQLILVRDDDPTESLNNIDQAQSLVSKTLAEFSAKTEELTAKRSRAQRRAEDAAGQAEQAFAQASEIEQDAAESGDAEQQRTLIRQAYEKQREGEAARHQAQLAEIEAKNYSAEIEPLETESNLYQQMAQQLDELRDRIQSSSQSAERAVSEARSMKQNNIGVVVQQFETVSDLYYNEVNQRISAAVELAEDAVAMLSKAEGAATGNLKQAINFELTTARIELAQLNATQARYANGFGKLADSLAGNPALTDESASVNFGQAVSRLQEDAQQHIAQAREVIAEAELMLQSLSGTTEQQLAKLNEALTISRQQLN
jgi:hypothetical protein